MMEHVEYWQTSDGQKFDDETEAEMHEMELEANGKVRIYEDSYNNTVVEADFSRLEYATLITLEDEAAYDIAERMLDYNGYQKLLRDRDAMQYPAYFVWDNDKQNWIDLQESISAAEMQLKALRDKLATASAVSRGV